jgi:hypothetical protein
MEQPPSIMQSPRCQWLVVATKNKPRAAISERKDHHDARGN